MIQPQLIVIRKVALEIGVLCALVEVVLFVILFVAYLLAAFYDKFILLIVKSINVIGLVIINYLLIEEMHCTILV